MLNNLAKADINPSLNHWSPFKGFHFRLLKPWLQNIYGSNLPNSLYTILYIRDPTLYPYSIVHFCWPRSMHNVFLWHIIQFRINMAIAIITTVLVVRYTALFWCEALAPLNLIFCCFYYEQLLHEIWGIEDPIIRVVSLDHHSLTSSFLLNA